MSKAIKYIHRERIPNEPTLILPGRLDHSELIELEKLLAHRKIIWLCEENVALSPSTENYLKQSKREVIAFSQTDLGLQQVGKNILSDLGSDGIAIFLPGQVNCLNGTSIHITGETLTAICALDLPTLPLAVHIPRELSLSIESPNSLPSAILVFGKLLTPSQCSVSQFRQELMIAFEEAFSSRSFLNGSLGYALLAGLKRHSKSKVVDGTNDQEKTYDIILGAAIALSKHLQNETNKKRIGIILPPGPGGLIANLAAIFAGKTPVNLNFTASKTAVQSSIQQADIDKFITADPFVRKMPDFAWPPNRDLIYIERVLPAMKKQITRWVVLSKILPTTVLAKMLKISNDGGDKEAILLFTSGSSGEPKGVPLTHRNVLANVCQFGTRLNLPENSNILGSLPLFHSFGCTVTLWFPCIEGLNLITNPSPLDSKRIAELIEQHKIILLLSTPTFLRGYMRRVNPEQLKSLQLVVTGAEKLPQNLAETFAEKFGIHPQEGYGLTETSPATNVNLPENSDVENIATIRSSRPSTVGNFLPGIAVKLTDPSSDAPLPLDQSGIIWMKGANIFPGYLNNQEKTDEVIQDGWFKTGDVGRLDSDGFLTIEGRISRFSKIGGEMVPHETVEAAINHALGLDEETERKIAVVGIPDEKKGEAIAILSTIAGVALEQECLDLRYRLLDQGIPSLWCPKQILPVEEIPVLASGKLDIKACEALAKQVQ
ncbi:AMP-binding protein [Rubritalea spongiae]|uniref:AMP-binding protein n=1 Tax=Rubritalea spongiae TaxID=430797 RepID=A0ABW5DZ41_9BACT